MIKLFIIFFYLTLPFFSYSVSAQVMSDEQYAASTEKLINSAETNSESSVSGSLEDFSSLSPEAARLLFEHEQWRLEFIRDTFESQYWVSWAIFSLVICLTIFALWIIHRQFEASSSSKDHSVDTKELFQSALKISKEGVEIRTPFIGLVILIITFFFLMAYLDNVFEISFIAPMS